jgi:hypothetical protein
VSLPEAAATAALGILGELVKRWVSDGRDPETEARRIVESYAGRSAVDTRAYAELDRRFPERTPNTGE